MLKSLQLENFTVFTDERFDFGKNLNIIVGENGTGKTHLIKAAYSALFVSAKGRNSTVAPTSAEVYFKREIATKLLNVFQAEQLIHLRQDGKLKTRAKVSCQFGTPTMDMAFSFDENSRTDVYIDVIPKEWVDCTSIFFPSRELLSIYRFVSSYVAKDDTKAVPFEETWRDTCLLLEDETVEDDRMERISPLLSSLQQAIGGNVNALKYEFYLHSGVEDGRKFTDISLVAEGFRKIAMIAHLIKTGALLGKGFLFWDEPEAGLNPRMILLIAKTIMGLSKNGIQVFIATHSLFLMRELYLLQAQSIHDELDVRCFGLHRQGEAVTVTQGPTIDDIGDITSLDEELLQSERLLDYEQRAA